MGFFRDTEAAVASGELSFVEKINPITRAANTAADILSKKWMDDAEAAKKAKILEEKEKRAARRAAEKERKAAEDKAAKLNRKAQQLATDFGADKTNSEALQYFTEQLYLFDGDTGAVYTKATNDFESGKLSFTTTTENMPLQGPLLTEMTTTEIADAEDSTARAFGDEEDPKKKDAIGDQFFRGRTEEDKKAGLRSGLGSQMRSILGEVGEADEIDKEVTTQGLKIDPNAKKDIEIDWMKVDTETQVKALRRMHDSGNQTLSAEDLTILEGYETDFESAAKATAAKEDMETIIDLAGKTPAERANIITGLGDKEDEISKAIVEAAGAMTSTEPADVSKFFTGISTVAGVDSKILAVKNSGLDEATQNSTIAQLEEHKKTLKQDKDELGLTDDAFYGTLLNNNLPIELVLKDNGDFYSVTQGKSFKPKDFVPNSLKSTDTATQLSAAAARSQEKVFAPMNLERSNVTSLFRQATTIDELVRASDGKVLTTLGGKLPALLKRIKSEYNSLSGFVRGSSDPAADIEKFSKELMPSEQELTDLGISADQYSRFQSLAIEFAYTYARTGMGQVRTTDADFNAAYKTVTAGSAYPTYSNSLRGLVNRSYNNAKDKHDKLLIHPSIGAAKLLPGYEGVFGEQMVSMDDYLATKDVTEAMTWMNTEVPLAEAPPTEKSAELPVGQQVSIFKNLEAFPGIQEKYNALRTSEGQAKFLEILSSQNGVPLDVIKGALGIELGSN